MNKKAFINTTNGTSSTSMAFVLAIVGLLDAYAPEFLDAAGTVYAIVILQFLVTFIARQGWFIAVERERKETFDN